ncbi:hypothetical protein BHM03_00004977 [Ensete ventricosum]|nr:hypothetical protein BHM03_00004977 [Ensete ventricosum]
MVASSGLQLLEEKVQICLGKSFSLLRRGSRLCKSYDHEEGALEWDVTWARWDGKESLRSCFFYLYGWRMGCRRHGRAVGRNDDGGERVAAGDGAGCSIGNDPFAAVHATMELTMGAASDEEKGIGYLCLLGFCT